MSNKITRESFISPGVDKVAISKETMFAVGEDGEREDEEGEDDDDDEGEEEVAQGNISNDERDNTDEHK